MLAQAAGSYRERPVEGVLQDHFACVWVHQLPRPDVQPVVVVPDGCIDLEWIDGALADRGPGSSAQDRTPGGRRDGGGIPLPPGGGRRVAGTAGVRNRRPPHPAGGVLGRRCAPRGRTSERGARYRRARAGDRERVDAARAIDSGASPDMHAAFELLATGAPPGKALIPWLAGELALSERTLRRRFDAAFGYGPKTLDRILRFQRFLKLLRGARNGSTAGLAMEAGYADQAHLGRESRRLAVTTPSGSQLSSRAARRNSSIASARAPGHADPGCTSRSSRRSRSFRRRSCFAWRRWIHSGPSTGLVAVATTERWQSGRSRRTRNAEYGQPYRGFDPPSPPN